MPNKPYKPHQLNKPICCTLSPVSKDFYAIIGVSRDASSEDIKKAYRRLSKELHPDKHKGDKTVEHKFKEINEAYEVLSDPEKRRMYDQFGSASPGGGPGGFNFSGFSGTRPEDFGGFADLFETFFGGRGPKRASQEQRGRDLEVRIAITFMESVRGVQKSIALERFVVCADCAGTGGAKGSALISCAECGGTGQVTRTAQSFFGAIRQAVLCTRCSGSGKRPEKACAVCSAEGRQMRKDRVTVDIPAGIDDGQTVRLRGYGEAGRNGATAGDLFVQVSVSSDTRFVRDGDDVNSVLAISVPDAALGSELPVETVHGSVSLRIPAGTQSGQILRIRGKGMPVLKSKSHGDHYVTVTVAIPEKLSKEERRLLEEWRRVS